MKVFGIRNKITGKYLGLPARDTVSRTFVECNSDEPRLFWSKQAAASALTTWLRGKQDGFKTGVVVKQSHRKAENMELVLFELHEVGQVVPRCSRPPRTEHLLIRLPRLMQEFPSITSDEVAEIFEVHPVYAAKVLRGLTEQGFLKRLPDRGRRGQYIYQRAKPQPARKVGEKDEQRSRGRGSIRVEAHPATASGTRGDRSRCEQEGHRDSGASGHRESVV